jgi:Predicted phosphohydrolase
MSLFAIADLHLSLGADKPMDVFRGWENYVEKIDKNWRAVVGPGDTVVIAGDVSWAMSLQGIGADFSFLNALPGKKLIVKGNHDFWWDTATKMKNHFAANGFDTIGIVHNSAHAVDGLEGLAVCGTRGWFYDEGGDKKILLREAGRLETSIRLAEKSGLEPVVFLHYPPVFSGYRCTEIMDILVKHQIKRCYYGHLHGKAASAAFEGECEGITFRLISCDHTGFRPVLVEKNFSEPV